MKGELSVVRLGDVAEVAAGQGAPQGVEKFGRGGLPFVRAGNLEALSNGLSERDLERISERVATEHRLRVFPAGTVLFAKSGMSATKGMVHELKEAAYVVSHLAAVVPSDQLNSSYLRHWFLAHPPSRLINDSAYPSIRLPAIAALTLPLPPLSEQRHIAALLDKADAIRSNRRESLQLLDELLRSAFLEIFGDPVRNERGWETKRLFEIADVDRGQFTPRPRNDPRFYGGDHPFIQTGDLTGSGGILQEWRQTLNELGTSVSRRFPAGSIAIAIAANIGDTAIVRFAFYCPDSVVGIVVKENSIAVEFLEYALRCLRPSLESRAPMTAQRNINLQVLRPLSIPIPPAPLQARFTDTHRRIYDLADGFLQSQAASESLHASLAQRLFAGKH